VVWWYVCSADRDEAYAQAAPPPARPPHTADCRGWLGQDAQGRPRPCLECKPWLRRRLRPRRRPAAAPY